MTKATFLLLAETWGISGVSLIGIVSSWGDSDDERYFSLDAELSLGLN